MAAALPARGLVGDATGLLLAAAAAALAWALAGLAALV